MDKLEFKKIENKYLSKDLEIVTAHSAGNGHDYKLIDETSGETLAEINFQNGGRQTHGVNGIFHEQLVEIIIDRLKFFNEEFNSTDNDSAIYYLELALKEMNLRTLSRYAKNTLGNNGEDYLENK